MWIFCQNNNLKKITKKQRWTGPGYRQDLPIEHVSSRLKKRVAQDNLRLKSNY